MASKSRQYLLRIFLWLGVWSWGYFTGLNDSFLFNWSLCVRCVFAGFVFIQYSVTLKARVHKIVQIFTMIHIWSVVVAIEGEQWVSLLIVHRSHYRCFVIEISFRNGRFEMNMNNEFSLPTLKSFIFFFWSFQLNYVLSYSLGWRQLTSHSHLYTNQLVHNVHRSSQQNHSAALYGGDICHKEKNILPQYNLARLVWLLWTCWESLEYM